LRAQSTLAAAETAKEGRDAYKISRTVEGTDACLQVGLDVHGITNPSTVYRNLSYPELYLHEQANKEGVVAKAEYGDTFAVDTGKYTGRSPHDRFIVLNPGTETADHIDWNEINQPTSPEVFQELYDTAVAHMNTVDKLYVADLYCGASPDTRRKVRFVHELAWQQHFVTVSEGPW
jgi:phosphoenolpyruvate carboxykinase (ATP)